VYVAGEKMTTSPHEQVALVIAGVLTALTNAVATLRELEAAASKPIVDASVKVANTVTPSHLAQVAKDNLPIRLQGKSRNRFIIAMQALLSGGTIADAEAACGVKTVREWCAKMGGVDAARAWAANNFGSLPQIPTQAIATAVPSVNDPRPEPIPLATAGGSDSIHEAIRVASAYCTKRSADGKGFRIRHDVFAYGKTTEDGLYALIRGVKKDGSFTNIHAITIHEDRFVSVKQGTAGWKDTIVSLATQMPPTTVFGGGATTKNDPVGSFFA